MDAKTKSIVIGLVSAFAAVMIIIMLFFTITGIKITSARKRFGSCNGKNSLCFSCLLMLYPKEAIECVVVHELAHIKHHNHSPSFYGFIDRVMPDYRIRESLLRKTPDMK